MEEQVQQALANSLFSSPTEKTFVDKILSRKDVDQVAEIVKKKRLQREDLMFLMYMLNSVELKLVNYGEWDRYIMAKYFVWIRDFCALAESLMDYKEDLEDKNKKKEIEITERAAQMIENNLRLIEHNIKFLIDLYFNLSRSTLSLGATGLMEILKNKFEVSYPNQEGGGVVAQEKKSPVQFKWSR